MSGVLETFTGELRYTSYAEGRRGAERGRESFRVDIHADGARVLAAHAEIDDAPCVVRDVNQRIGPDGRPKDSFVRIAVDGQFRGSGWFRFGKNIAECEAITTIEGRISQRMELDSPLVAFGNHAIINDGFLLSLYDLSQGPGTQLIEHMYLSSPDHRGATGPMFFPINLAIQYHGLEEIEVEAGRFEAHKFSLPDVPGLLEKHPDYDLWCTSDGHYILLKAAVGGYMQTRYELGVLNHIRHDGA
tara:strand:- start:64764 stop:65498 length:735 start_codon:yes stop_codon:yes gene_type:complete